MSARNEEKLGSSLEPSVQSRAATPPPANSILNFPTPTEFVELPSGGKHYPEGHPLHGVDTIEIKVMTAKEEDILINESYLKQGVAIDKLLRSVLVDKSIKLEDLLIGDKNAVLFATRISGLGPHYGVNVSCTACGTAEEKQLDLREFKFKELDFEDVVETERNTYKITLPATNLVVEFKILNGHDEKSIEETMKKRKKYKVELEQMLYTMELMVVSINDVEDRSLIKQCLTKIPVRDCRYLRSAYEKVTPDVDINFEHPCSECGHTQEVTMPLTADFFWSK
jgi:hypothetical protein